MQHFDTIVIGVGAMGSAALWQLARRGQRVLGLERFDLGHMMGSSHGMQPDHPARLFRTSKLRPASPPRLRAVARDRAAGEEQLLFVTGGLDAGRPDGRVVKGSLRACREHALAHEVLSGPDIARRFPGYRLPADYVAVYQPDAGFLASERAIMAACGARDRGGRRDPCARDGSGGRAEGRPRRRVDGSLALRGRTGDRLRGRLDFRSGPRA